MNTPIDYAALESLRAAWENTEIYDMASGFMREVAYNQALRNAAPTLIAAAKERDEAVAEVRRWRSSFDGHVYVKNEDYAKDHAELARARAARNECPRLRARDFLANLGEMKQ